MIVYLSGPVTDNENYREQFTLVAQQLEARGHDVINPAELDCVVTEGVLSYEDYLEIDLLLLKKADMLVQLPGWEKSRGANRELGFALGVGKGVCTLKELL
ncbi:MAG: DUF4406 domain-containing protein [bacterium]|nr:DUF4406 domain-containing protein [bacterium]